MGFFDTLLTAIAPERAVKRVAAQTAIRAINSGYSNYGASLHKKSMRGWMWHGGSPKEDIEDNLRVLRERSRDAYMGVPLATGAIKTMRTNVVCGGLTPTPQIDNAFLGISDEEAQKINEQIAREFALWANKPTCDADRIDNFYINAIKLVVDVIHGLLPVIEPVIQGIVGLIKGIVSVTITVANAIIGTLNKLSFTVPGWVPALGGKQFGFNLKEVAMPAFANGGFTHGVSIAGEAGTEAVISFKPSVHDSNVENWVRAGRMLGVSGEDATRAAGVRYFANGGFTDGSKEKLDNLIDFSKAYGKYALRSNGIRTTGDALSMLWTVANNSMSGDASLALAATSLAADVAPLLLNKYLGSDSPVTTALTEAAKNYNGGTVLSSWQDGVLTDTGTPLYVLPPRDTGRTLSEIPVSAYQNTPVPGGNGGSSPQFVFAPNITITGDADRQQIASIMEDEYEKFKAFMDKYNRENNRTRYA